MFAIATLELLDATLQQREVFSDSMDQLGWLRHSGVPACWSIERPGSDAKEVVLSTTADLREAAGRAKFRDWRLVLATSEQAPMALSGDDASTTPSAKLQDLLDKL